MTSQEIASIVGGRLSAPGDLVITGAQGLSEATSSDVSFVANPKYLDKAAASAAGLLLIPKEMPDPGRPCICVGNPQLAFAQILTIIEKEKHAGETGGVHPSAAVSPRATIGRGAYIGAFTVVEEGAAIGDNSRLEAQCYVGRNSRIGSNCRLYPQVTVREEVRIGDRAIIHSGTVIGSDGFGFVPYEKGIFKIPQIGTVEIGDDVELGGNVTIDRATTGATSIGKGTKVDNLCHIAHNVRIGEYSIIVAQSGIAGSTKIGKGVTMAAQSGAGGHISIGDGAVIAARAGVTRDVAPKEVVSGFPARPHREELKVHALVNRLPELFETLKSLTKKLR